jgi:excisionase family DNA binding protein
MSSNPDRCSQSRYLPFPQASQEQEFLTPKQAAAYLRVSKSYLDKLRVYGGGPKFLRFGRKILYRRSDLDRWVEQRCFGSTSEYTLPTSTGELETPGRPRSGEHQ